MIYNMVDIVGPKGVVFATAASFLYSQTFESLPHRYMAVGGITAEKEFNPNFLELLCASVEVQSDSENKTAVCFQL